MLVSLVCTKTNVTGYTPRSINLINFFKFFKWTVINKVCLASDLEFGAAPQ